MNSPPSRHHHAQSITSTIGEFLDTSITTKPISNSHLNHGFITKLITVPSKPQTTNHHYHSITITQFSCNQTTKAHSPHSHKSISIHLSLHSSSHHARALQNHHCLARQPLLLPSTKRKKQNHGCWAKKEIRREKKEKVQGRTEKEEEIEEREEE
jgi:hypothetical protein